MAWPERRREDTVCGQEGEWVEAEREANKENTGFENMDLHVSVSHTVSLTSNPGHMGGVGPGQPVG